MDNHGAYEPVGKGTIRTCCITMNMADKLRLLACPEEILPAVREIITDTWEGGIQVERGYNGTHEFKLRGSPWHAHGETGIASRRLLCGILSVMATNGWNLIQSTSVSKREGDKDTLFFEKDLPDSDARVFPVSFNMSNRIRVIDAPDLMPCVLDACTQYWTKGVVEEAEVAPNCLELKLKGNPWYPVGDDAVRSKLVLSKIVANLRSLGFRFYASVDLSYGTEGQDLETWVFRRISHGMENTNCESCGQRVNKPEQYYLPEEEEEVEEEKVDEEKESSSDSNPE